MAKSILPACERATRVTTDVGSRLATPATADSMPPPDTSERRAAIRSRRSRKRSSARQVGAREPGTRVGVKELPPMALSGRVLTTKQMLRASTAVSRSA